ncbi:MAG TPA: hypothetical protein VHK01_14020 [Lacipirellulaceae bacterium]|jgi:hypothetical protein|nr:hypothetical protein [Lacipirellulaceae bacterium]
MSTELSSELLAYHAFIKTTLDKGGSIDEDATPAAFAEYQEQLSRLRSALQPATDRFRRGEDASEIDINQLVDDVLKNGANPHEPD